MFDINEMKSKNLIENNNGSRIIESVETGKYIYFENTRTKDNYKLVLTKKNGSSYKGVLQKEVGEDIEKTILTNGKIAVFVASRSIISLYFKEDNLYIITAEEINIYE